MSETGQPNASTQYLDYLQWPSSHRAPTHGEWHSEIINLKSQLAAAQHRATVLEAALKRLASMEAFDVSRCVTKHDDELIARINFAEQQLKALHAPTIPEGRHEKS